MARVPVLLLLTCLLGFYLIDVARADCYHCIQGSERALAHYGSAPEFVSILNGVEASVDCENVKDSTKKCSGTNKCVHMHIDAKTPEATVEQLEVRTCATGVWLEKWAPGYGSIPAPKADATITGHSCEGDLCNKIPMTEMKQRAEEAAKKQSSTASYLVLPVVTFFASNILAFF
ncbi:unnamed protein product, partial [Mesorhabditis spiculigera]